MVESNEIAIIYKRKIDKEGNEIFIPIKVISGYFEDVECWFVSNDGTAYHHISEWITSGNVYGCRKSVSQLIKKFPNLSLSEIKKRLLESAKKFTLYRNIENGQYIIKAKNNETGKITIYTDQDSEMIQNYNDEEATSAVETMYKKSANQKTETENQTKAITTEFKKNLTPEEIIEMAKKNVKGQDEALKKIVTVLWYNINKPNFNKKNMLIIGPTGVGKTYIFQKLSKIFGVEVVILPIAGTTQSGYVGASVNELLHQAYLMCGRNRDKLEHSIIVLDEIDKLAKSGDEKIASTGVQQELLKIIEGTNIMIGSEQSSKIMIDTSNITFVTTGAFQDLFTKQKRSVGFGSEEPIQDNTITTEKLVNYGMLAEFIGRQKIKIVLNPLTVDILIDIIKNNEESELNNVLDVFNELNIKCTNLDETIELIAKDALSKNIGARGIDDTIMEMFINILHDIANNPNEYEEIILGSNIMKDNQDYILVKRKKGKRRVRTNDSI